jgi:hypothetical protein
MLYLEFSTSDLSKLCGIEKLIERSTKSCYKVWLILMFTRSKRAIKGRLESWMALYMFNLCTFIKCLSERGCFLSGLVELQFSTLICIFIRFRVRGSTNTCL